ncbi:AraC family transcriptional regulator [Elizabethkingia miricola]|uniref:helix-turn-helix transcriptional regulator n=1 Tax=Elizabethkingia bruuniana TaxID=1756149 RepID=UPI00099AFAA1|nr:helix-turn-helix transcriptional regulator [Elizabethkingia bruuniana]OPC64644.1 DNA-binding protein [Elizabethkingia bruuniana]RBI92557.1 AraC family transcriptional regulator [Elizabethkingia miricola]
MQFLPDQYLQPFIRHYLFLESTQQLTGILRLFTDGSTGVVFSLQGSLATDLSHKTQLPGSFLYGQISDFWDLYTNSGFSFIIVVFSPLGMKQLTGIPAYEMKNQITDANHLFPNISFLTEELFESNNYEKQIQLLNLFFLKTYTAGRAKDISTPISLMDILYKDKDSGTISNLVKRSGYSERHIERIFKEHIGISPKAFSSIIRLHRFLRLLSHPNESDSMTSLGYTANYFDQSHLIREFKKYTGITPKQYMDKTQKLATNFLNINKP